MENYKLIKTYEDACLVLNKNNIDNHVPNGYITDGIKLETIAEAIRGKSSIFDCEGDRAYTIDFQFCTEEFAKKINIFSAPERYIILKDNSQNFKYFYRYIDDRNKISASANTPFAQDTYEKAEYFANNFTELWLSYVSKRNFKKEIFKMSLDEAIKHCEEKIQEQTSCDKEQCALDHVQLLEWLRELKTLSK